MRPCAPRIQHDHHRLTEERHFCPFAPVNASRHLPSGALALFVAARAGWDWAYVACIAFVLPALVAAACNQLPTRKGNTVESPANSKIETASPVDVAVLPIVLGVLIAYVLTPVVSWVERKRVPRGAAIVYAATTGHGGWLGFVNAGAEAARGELLLFCDGDDIVRPGWIANLSSALTRAEGGFDAVSGLCVDFSDDGDVPKWLAPPPDDELPRFMGRPYLLSGNLGIHRSAFQKVHVTVGADGVSVVDTSKVASAMP